MVLCRDEMDTAYLDNLDEFINDEGRIVTYKWLSLTLGVHSNVAKQMLYHFTKWQRSGGGGGGDLNVTYLLSGLVEESDGDLRKVVKVVREAELEAARVSMSAVSSIHVYSVQRSTLPDLGVLYGADYDIMKQHLSNTSRYSGIRCSEAHARPSTNRLQQVVEKTTSSLHENVPKTNEKKEKIDAKLDNATTTTTTPVTTASTSTSSSSSSSRRPTNPIVNMFAQQSKRQECGQKTATKKEKGPTKTKASGISAFFTKGTAQQKHDTSSKSDSPTSGLHCKSDSSPGPTTTKSVELMLTEDSQQSLKGVVDSQALEKGQVEDKEEVAGGGSDRKVKTAKSKTSTSSQKKRKSKGKKEEPKTKRTRIMQLSDSDSDEEEGREEEEDKKLSIHPSTPPLVRVSSDSEEENEGEKSFHHSRSTEEETNPGMRKKMVEEMYEDEEGYLVTTKVYKYVKLTEEELRQQEKEEEEAEQMKKKKDEERRIKEEEERKKEKSSPPGQHNPSSSSSSASQKKKGRKRDDNKIQPNILSFFSKK